MSSTVTAVTLAMARTHTYAVLSTTVGVIAILLLLVLLAHKELLRARGGSRVTERLRAFDVAIIPLLVSFLCIITVRFALFLH